MNLKYNDIDLNEGYIKIKNAKFNKNRLAFINEDLVDNLKYYITNCSSDKCDYIFYNERTNNKISYSIVSDVFHKIIENANFDKNKIYRIHDFRHTFAVNNIKNAFENNEDVDALLPILMNYMGHSDIKETEYYLRLTPDVYENMAKKYEEQFNNIFNNEED